MALHHKKALIVHQGEQEEESLRGMSFLSLQDTFC